MQGHNFLFNVIIVQMINHFLMSWFWFSKSRLSLLLSSGFLYLIPPSCTDEYLMPKLSTSLFVLFSVCSVSLNNDNIKQFYRAIPQATLGSSLVLHLIQ